MRRPLLTILVLVVAALPAHADAPVGQYEAFAKNLGFILDTKTHLRWQRFPDMVERPPLAADDYCYKADSGAKGWGSPGGWRLPTVKELLTLVDEEPHDEFDPSLGTTGRRYIDRNAFAGTPTKLAYVALSPDSATTWIVDFATGTASRQNGTTASYYVRCVRAE
ncbi:MAG TPA: DUF1566 domain-containing protein [Polyangiaceae bacterium]